MAHTKKNRISDYWSTDHLISIPMFSQLFSRDRYLYLLRYLHFNNNQHHRPGDRLFKIQPFLNHLIDKFKTTLVPYQNLVIDKFYALAGSTCIQAVDPIKKVIASQVLYSTSLFTQEVREDMNTQRNSVRQDP
jgi:hypothetical protein